MGLLIDVYRSAGTDCTNNGISSTYTTLCLVNASGPFNPSGEYPPVIMQNHVPGCLRIVPAYRDGSEWRAVPLGYMMGGNYGATSDSRFAELAEQLLGHRFYGAVPIHDRNEG